MDGRLSELPQAGSTKEGVCVRVCVRRMCVCVRRLCVCVCVCVRPHCRSGCAVHCLGSPNPSMTSEEHNSRSKGHNGPSQSRRCTKGWMQHVLFIRAAPHRQIWPELRHQPSAWAALPLLCTLLIPKAEWRFYCSNNDRGFVTNRKHDKP